MGAAETVSGLRLAVRLLTRVPLPWHPADTDRLAEAVPWLSLVGALVGLASAGVYAAGSLVLPDAVAATLAIGSGIALTGALHEDGLGDTADALAGGWTRKERLRIMRDPGLGTFGVCAIGISLLLRVSALSMLTPWSAAAALVAAHAVGRAAAIGVLGALTPIGGDGMGASYARNARPRHVLGGLVGGALIASATLGVLSLPAMAAAAAGATGLGVMARRRIGGFNGDVLGATEQVAEVAVLLVVTAGATQSWVPVPWWR
jgi:adenosylcobinamide-GDP ribazoletransferase